MNFLPVRFAYVTLHKILAYFFCRGWDGLVADHANLKGFNNNVTSFLNVAECYPYSP